MSHFDEDRRQAVHVGMGLWALLLRWTTWPQAAALATAAVLFNWLVLPRVGGRSLYREGDRARGFPIGILLYPFVILLLILVFRERLDIVAAVWGVLAAGDGFATLVGRRVRGARLPWNIEKSVAGSVAFVVLGTAGAALLGWWAAGRFDTHPSFGYWLAAAFAAALVAGLVETIPVRLDDNISVAAAAALILWCIEISSGDLFSRQVSGNASRMAIGLGLNAVAAAAGWAAGTVTWSGVAAGCLIGTVIYAFGGTGAWLLLLLGFIAASVTSRVGYRRKLQLGIAEERGGRRSAANALANTGAAGVAALLSVSSPYREEALLALVAALVAGSSDTVASEIGKAFGRRTFLVVGLRPVPPGTSGAVSLEGTIAGIGAAALLALFALQAGLIATPHLLIVVIAVTAASFLESALGATLENRRVLNNDLLNFINSSAAAAIALLLASRM